MGRHGRAAEGSVLLAGRYELIEPVGRGGMAEVWCAKDVSLGRLVAVKLLDRVPFADPHQDPLRDDVAGAPGERILREARYAARLVHPNVVQIYDAAADGDRIFLIMELVPGRNLSAVLKRQGPLAPSQVADLGAQAARALAAAHAAGVVHGDVKPANLLLTDDGVLKLTGFGIARRPGPAASGQPARAVLGTAAYLAPELASGHPPSRAGDLYALGCVLYELSTGQRPFEADTATALFHRHLHESPTPPSRLQPWISTELEQAILRLLAKQPETRPIDATRVADALEIIALSNSTSLTANEPTDSTQGSPAQVPTRARRARHRAKTHARPSLASLHRWIGWGTGRASSP